MKGALLHKEILAHFCIAGPGNIRRHEKDGFACKLFQQRCPELQLGWIETKSGIQIFHRGRYLKIKEALDNNSGGLFAIDAPGGTGKTFLVTLILKYVRGQKKNITKQIQPQ